MTIIFAALGAGIAAFVVWLTVRIANRRERQAKWMAVGLAVMCVLYVLSFGPACWLAQRRFVSQEMLWQSFRPHAIAITYGPKRLATAIRSYGAAWSDRSLPFCVYCFERNLQLRRLKQLARMKEMETFP